MEWMHGLLWFSLAGNAVLLALNGWMLRMNTRTLRNTQRMTAELAELLRQRREAARIPGFDDYP